VALGADRPVAVPATASSELGSRRWPQLDAARPLVLVPVGSTEQHGPHLPLATDTMIAEAVAWAVCDRLVRGGAAVTVAPAVAYGASGEHEAFPGTVSIGHDALRLLLVEHARSSCRWAGGVVFVNGHGGNVETLVEVVDLLRNEGRRVAWVTCATPDGDAHAGRTETSLLLHLAPEAVALDHAEPGATAPLADLLPRLRRDGVRAVSANGVLGDPAGASVAEGARVFDAVVDRVCAAIAGRVTGDDPWSGGPGIADHP
jgi:mycofactocin system creatininase family protein